MGAVSTIWNALKQLVPNLTESNASIEAKIIDVVGTFADAEALERKNTLNVINAALANQRVTTIEYYRRKAVAFQNGDQLSYDPISQAAFYETVDTEKQIIKQAYIVGTYPQYTLLVNALGDDGHLRALTSDELASFKTYFSAFQPLGLNLNIASLQVAQISDPYMVIYVERGVDAGDAVAQITQNLLNHEAKLRTSNTVTLTEISDVIQQFAGVRAVGFGNPIASEVSLSGSTNHVYPTQGVFQLLNGAFTFATPITVDMIKTIS